MEDVLFEMFKDVSTGRLSVSKFLGELAATGLQKDDPRLQEMMTKIRSLHGDGIDHWAPELEALTLDKDQFKSIIKENIILISRALRQQFIIPSFHEFTTHIEQFYYRSKPNKEGKNANYIPQLAKYDPNFWGVSLCTVDGQRFSIGDTSESSCLLQVVAFN